MKKIQNHKTHNLTRCDLPVYEKSNVNPNGVFVLFTRRTKHVIISVKCDMYLFCINEDFCDNKVILHCVAHCQNVCSSQYDIINKI